MINFEQISSKLDSFFPTPRYLNFDPVAIDILPTSIRLMKLKVSKNGLVPAFYKEVRLKNKVDITEINNDKTVNTEAVREVIDVLKSLKKEFKLKYVVSSLPELKTYTFRTQLPKEASKKLSSAIRFGLEENVPLSVDDVNFDYSVIESDDSNEVDVVVSVFPKSIINVYTKILKSAGLYPLAFEAESSALAGSVITEGDKEPYLLVRLLEERIGLAIVEDGVVQYASTLQINAKKVSEDFKSKEATDLSEALNKLLIFWFTSKKDPVSHDKIQTVFVTGEYATAPGIQEFLERHLKINVEVANIWSNCFSTDKHIPEINQKDALNFSVAIGLSIKGIKHA